MTDENVVQMKKLGLADDLRAQITTIGARASEQDRFMTCGVAPTEAEVQARIGWLRLDDDKIDAARGAARKYQS
jgi:hypothetical protein